MIIPLLAFALGAAEDSLTDQRKGPEWIDFTIAQAAHIHEFTDIGSNGIVHCNRFRRYHANRTTDPDVYAIRYAEYRSKGPWKTLTARLRRNGDKWLWISGDEPKCSIMILTD